MFRLELPVDNDAHEFTVTGPVCAVGPRPDDRGRASIDVISVWYMHQDHVEPYGIRLQTFGTGMYLPDDIESHLGTLVIDEIVVHVFSLAPGAGQPGVGGPAVWTVQTE